MGFQQTVNLTPGVAVAGDPATGNPRASYPSPEGGFVAGAAGVTVGRFAWIQSDGVTVLNSGSGVPAGIIMRNEQALITTYLAEDGNVIPQGFPVTIMRTGDYYITATVAAAVRGNKAFAKLADGTMEPGAAGATISGFIETPFSVTEACAIGALAVLSA